jgi:four helix bundle protein
MTYEVFEDLPVWKEAVLLIEEIYRLTGTPNLQAPAAFKSQIERAALSVSNNIAEGFERGTKAELISFLYIARGSAAETRSMLRVLLRNRAWGGDPAKGIELALSCSKQIRTWAQCLQDSEIKGPRHLNTRSCEQENDRKKAAAFRKNFSKTSQNHIRCDVTQGSVKWTRKLNEEYECQFGGAAFPI